MVYLAARDNSTPAPKHEIANAEGISADYTEQVLMQLRNRGLVASHRGIKGGFSLATPPAEITVAKILEATEGPLNLAPCLGDEPCPRQTACVARDLWSEANKTLTCFFENVTVAELAARAKEKDTAITFDI